MRLLRRTTEFCIPYSAVESETALEQGFRVFESPATSRASIELFGIHLSQELVFVTTAMSVAGKLKEGDYLWLGSPSNLTNEVSPTHIVLGIAKSPNLIALAVKAVKYS